ncbi:hypothetical protein LEP1GSC188_3913 [Leptospira weilii serovar Topaz str. LT2116]|uniref:Uncharacterized protein n=1 Tax=Leptospira weilii serovar Topaz str. LT2116 TaxID=1088540 RepID=M3GV44_9LEPT|nr:hypothetical protein LEP1GSC188_3913 [Leptospira weilii serovar Topaz str. LT2116]
MSLDRVKLVIEDFKNGNVQEYSKSIYKSILKYYDVKNKIAWDWASMDSAMVKAPKGGV